MLTHTHTHTHLLSLHCHPRLSHPGWLIRRCTESSMGGVELLTVSVCKESINLSAQTAPQECRICNISVFWGRRLDASLVDEALYLSVCVCQRDKAGQYQLLITYSNSRFMTPSQFIDYCRARSSKQSGLWFPYEVVTNSYWNSCCTCAHVHSMT